MNATEHTDLSRLCIHTITTKPWSIEAAAKNYMAAGVKGISVWRDALDGRNVTQTGNMLREHGLEIVSLCRGGFFAHKDSSKRKAAIDDNKRAIEQAAQLGTSMVVLVCGADPSQSLQESRNQIRDGIAAVVPEALAANIKLTIEPLHPMYADTRSAINTLEQANDMVEALNTSCVGVAIDVYHVWWDPSLQMEIKRCGLNGNIAAFHICDWKSPSIDMLNDRGVMGDGCIPVKQIKSWVEATGFTGFNEVEIFSNAYWKEDQSAFLAKIIEAYKGLA